ncbi:MAG TPA: hypothetical protein VFA12_02130 [Stellaceae bacterium]|nr:hypothetical protein [Stellaceae bacterium]
MRVLLRRVLVNMGLAVFALAVAITALGVVLRLVDGLSPFEFRNFARDYIDQFNRVKSAMYDERLGWRPKPNLRLSSRIKGVLKSETTDAYGNRVNGDATPSLPSGGVLVSGDSFAYGADVSDGETWPAYLQTAIDTPVTNASAKGWGTDQIVMRAEEMIELAHPRTLILGIYPPDIQRAEMEIDFGAYKPYYTVEQGALVLHGVPVPHLTASVHDLGWERGVLGYSYVAFWIARRLQRWSTFNQVKQATPPGTGEKVTCLLLRRLSERARHDRIRLMLAMVYGNFNFEREQPAVALHVLECARREGYQTIDTWAGFAKIFAADRAAFDSLYVFPDRWSHMSSAGNRLVAAAIAQRLREVAAGEPTGSAARPAP